MPDAIVACILGKWYVLEYEPRDCVWYAKGESYGDCDEAEDECRRINGWDEDDEED